MPIGLCWVVVCELAEHHAKMGNSCRHATEIGHVGPLGGDVQRDVNRQYAPNQAVKYVGYRIGQYGTP